MKRVRNNSVSKEHLKEIELKHQQHLDAKEEYRNSLKAKYASLSREEILEKLLDKEVYEYFYGH